MRGKYHNLTPINAHVPTEDKDIGVKEQFYDDLQKVHENTAEHDVVIALGDLNAKIEKKAYSQVLECTLCMTFQTRMVKWCATLQS
jgi:hypothetical protein